MNRHITVREMRLDDIEAVSAIEAATFSAPWSANGFFSYLLRSDAHFLVAEAAGVIAGYCGTILIPPESEITNICVDEVHRRQGIASALLNAQKKFLKTAGMDTLHLEVRRSNEEAIALYKKHGFAPVGTRPNYYTDPAEDALLMTCRF